MEKTEVIESKKCPTCKQAHMYLKYKYNAREFMGANIATAVLFLLVVPTFYFSPLVGGIVLITAYGYLKKIRRAAHHNVEKHYYWYCYKCDLEYYDRRLDGKVLYRSERKKKDIYANLTKKKPEGAKPPAAAPPPAPEE